MKPPTNNQASFVCGNRNGHHNTEHVDHSLTLSQRYPEIRIVRDRDTVLHCYKTLKTSRQCEIFLCLLFFTSNGSEEDQYKLLWVWKWRVHRKLPQSMYKSHPNWLRTLGGNCHYIVHLSISVSISIQNLAI